MKGIFLNQLNMICSPISQRIFVVQYIAPLRGFKIEGLSLLPIFCPWRDNDLIQLMFTVYQKTLKRNELLKVQRIIVEISIRFRRNQMLVTIWLIKTKSPVGMKYILWNGWTRYDTVYKVVQYIAPLRGFKIEGLSLLPIFCPWRDNDLSS